jgi:hypothetical protein
MATIVHTAHPRQLEFLQWLNDNILFPPESPYRYLIKRVLDDQYYININQTMLNELRELHTDSYLKSKK